MRAERSVRLTMAVASVVGVSAMSIDRASAADGPIIEEIVVTALKREQSLQDVSVSITAISGEQLERFRIESIDDVVAFTPGVSTDSPNVGVENRQVGIRGVQTQSGTILSSVNTVGYYVDNIPVSVAEPRLIDLERVEVLRGPQGTLYGASSLAGVIKLVTRKPSFDEFSGTVQGSVSSVAEGETGTDVSLSLNVPISDRLALRASAYREDGAGYVDLQEVDLLGQATGTTFKDFNEVEDTGGRINALFAATDDFRISASYMWGSTEATASTEYFNPAASGSGPVLLGRFAVPGEAEFALSGLEIGWDFETFQITSTTSLFDQTRATGGRDSTDSLGFLTTPVQIVRVFFDLDRDETTHETRIISTWDRPLNYIAGVFYSRHEQGYVVRIPVVPGTFIDLNPLVGLPPGTLPPDPAVDNSLLTTGGKHELEETALFGMVTYDFTERLSAGLGLRAFRFDSSRLAHFRGVNLFVAGGEIVVLREAVEEDVVPRLSVEYRPNDDLLLYFTAAEGFRTGGTNFPLADTPQCAANLLATIGTTKPPLSFESDALWSYELGAKKSWPDRRLTANAAIFRMDWQDIQIGLPQLCNVNGTTVNAGKATSRGIELELDAAITGNFHVGLGLSYIDAEFSEDVTLGGSFIFASNGTRIPDIPGFTGNIRTYYTFPIGGKFAGFLRGTYSYRGNRTARPQTSQGGPSPIKDSYGLLNLQVGSTYEGWTIALFGENLTDEQPSFTGQPNLITGAGGVPVDYSLRPRTVGLSVRKDF